VIHDKAKVVAHLRGLADGSVEPEDRVFGGLCWELFMQFRGCADAWIYLVGGLAEDWEDFSGNKRFPVPSPDIRFSAYDAYQLGFKRWADDEYGASRRRLCAHLADKIEAMERELDV